MTVNEDNNTAITEYRRAVESLLRIASMGTGSSRLAAQVLLSAYNGYEFHVDLAELGLLSPEHIGNVLKVIWGRTVSPCLEPHEVIENGDAVFEALWDNWRRLHVQNRWKRTCPECSGKGRRWVNPEKDDSTAQCCRCDGRGLLAEVTWPGYELADPSGSSLY